MRGINEYFSAVINGGVKVDFVDWCGFVLGKVIKASGSPEVLSLGYLTDSALAEALFGEEMSEQFIGSVQRTQLHTCIDELARNGLVVKKKVGQMFKVEVTNTGRAVGADLRPLWREIFTASLSDQSEQLLVLINRLSQRIEPNIVWLEDVTREQLPELGWADKDKRIQAVRELEHYGFVRSHPPFGSEVDLTATYRGVVWETRRSLHTRSEPESAHVLFMDIVGYSRLPMDMQTQVRQQLNELVRAAETYSVASARGIVISRSAGDAIALIFFGNPQAPVKCAIEISRVLAGVDIFAVRMGIHSGPVIRDEDINQQSDVAGGGINYAQRVMDAGSAGHILITRAVADNLNQLGGWGEYLHDLGEIEVKHGVRLHVFNLYSEEFGNPVSPDSSGASRSAATSVVVPLLQILRDLNTFAGAGGDLFQEALRGLTSGLSEAIEQWEIAVGDYLAKNVSEARKCWFLDADLLIYVPEGGYVPKGTAHTPKTKFINRVFTRVKRLNEIREELRLKGEGSATDERPDIRGEIREVFFERKFSLVGHALHNDTNYGDYSFFVNLYLKNLGAPTTIERFSIEMQSGGRQYAANKFPIGEMQFAVTRPRRSPEAIVDIERSNDIPLDHTRPGWLHFEINAVEDASEHKIDIKVIDKYGTSYSIGSKPVGEWKMDNEESREHIITHYFTP